ncbi:Map Methionine aminopeptidase [uncultured Caudovirales phage]|uniref:Map Methionine aminopeptidase n=1 Tax=uncultured Caudovirales phage TaxID=2100421 RepID=A0A6J5RQI4_9CAUD|nr:Map Methionine aminopeptidase [uncultured Caudovirales phage]
MRSASKIFSTTNGLVRLKEKDWVDKQRIAGKIAAKTLTYLENQIKNKTTSSLIELNDAAEKLITDAGGILTFKGYKGFPAGVCISVNKQLVHGIPSSYKLQDGDIISFDLGVTIDGAIADTATTCIYGNPKSDRHALLVQATKECLKLGIESIKIGDRIGAIGSAIYNHAKKSGFSVITQYGGHGLDWNTPHAHPFIDNKSDIDKGLHIQPGLTICIEPMLVIGSNNTKVLNDGWTVVTPDVGAHEEHTLFVHEDHVEIITERN